MASTPLFLLFSLLFSATLFYLQLQPLSASSQSDQLIILPLAHFLGHSDFPNATIHHLIKTFSRRSAARHRHHRHRHRHQQRAQEVSLPLSFGSDYTLSLSVGPPDSPTTVQLYMDTGSDLVWFPCSPFECILCEGKEIPSTSPSPPPPPPAGSHLVSCRSAACAAAHSAVASSSSSSSDLCAIAGCPLEAIETASSCAAHPCPLFYYAYGDGSLVARLRRGPLSAGPPPPAGLHLRLRPLCPRRARRRRWLRPRRPPFSPLPARRPLPLTRRPLLVLSRLPLLSPQPPPPPQPPHPRPIPSHRRSIRTGIPVRLHPPLTQPQAPLLLLRRPPRPLRRPDPHPGQARFVHRRSERQRRDGG